MGDKTQIEWTREIAGHPGYRVGTDGTVWSCWKRVGLGRGRGSGMVLSTEWHPLRPHIDKSGYPTVQLRRGNRYKVAHLVLEAFAGPCPAGMVCCHYDGNPLNSNRENLRWATQEENIGDQRRIGTLVGGERHGNAKLSNSQVEEMRRLGGTAKQKEIGQRFGVTQSTVSVILAGKSRTAKSHSGRGL